MPVCQNCGAYKAENQLDAKPRRLRSNGIILLLPDRLRLWLLRRAHDRGEDFDWLEGACCYGPGWRAGPRTDQPRHDRKDQPCL